MGYDLKIEYKPGKDNVVANALSRVCFMAWSEPQAKFLQQLKVAVSKDTQLQRLIHSVS